MAPRMPLDPWPRCTLCATSLLLTLLQLLPVADAGLADSRHDSSPGVARALEGVGRAAVFEDGIIYPGNELERVKGSSSGACLQLCRDSSSCLAFSYAKSSGWCHLKGAWPRPFLTKVPDERYTSGYLPKALDLITLEARPNGSSLFCFSLVQLDTYERELLKAQYERGDGKGIFGCDEYEVLSSKLHKLVGRVFTRDIHSATLECPRGGAFNSALNRDIFVSAWRRIIEDGRFRFHDWTVKVDPDTVFFPSRLRAVVRDHPDGGDGRGLYLSNCPFGLRGGLEVFSRAAVETWGREQNRCIQFLDGLCLQPPCSWSEDVFMDQCLGGVLKVTRRVEPDRLLVDDHCNPPDGYRSCQNKVAAGFHAFQDPKEFYACMAAAEKAEAYQWVQYPGYDLAHPGVAEALNASDMAAVKRRVEQKGYIGFTVEEGRALLKASDKPITAANLNLAKVMNTTVAYVFGPASATPPDLDAKDWQCWAHAEPVHAFRSTVRGGRAYFTYHTGDAREGEEKEDMRFYAFKAPVIGGEPVFAYWSPEHQNYSLRIGEPLPSPKQVDVNSCLSYVNVGCWSISDQNQCVHSRDGRSRFHGSPCVWCGGGNCHKTVSKCLTHHWLQAHGGVLPTWTTAACSANTPPPEHGSLQFYAFPVRRLQVEPVGAFWQPGSHRLALHTGEAHAGEEKDGVAFYAPTFPLKAPAPCESKLMHLQRKHSTGLGEGEKSLGMLAHSGTLWLWVAAAGGLLVTFAVSKGKALFRARGLLPGCRSVSVCQQDLEDQAMANARVSRSNDQDEGDELLQMLARTHELRRI